MQLRMAVAGVTLALLSACGTVGTLQKPPPQQAAVADASQISCGRQLQEGCLEVRILNFKADLNNPVMANLPKPVSSQEERQKRVQGLAPAIWSEYQAGRVQASEPRTFLLMFWGINPVPAANLASYRVNGANNQYRHTTTRVSVEDVTGSVAAPLATSSTARLGPPTRVYRIRADGPLPIGASLQAPWTMFTNQSYLLVCSEDGRTVYPNASLNQGLHTTAATFNWLRDVRKTRRVLQVFLSQ